jgi:hypothetical protein
MRLDNVTKRSGGLLSRHAEQRAKQRGVRRQTLEDLYAFSDVERHAGQGCFAIEVSHERLAHLRENGLEAWRLDALSRLRAIVGADERLVTV